MKSIALVFACFCVALCAVTGFGLFYLWSNGLLSPEKISDVRQMLSKGEASDPKSLPDVDPPIPSLEEVIEARARLSAEHQSRDRELSSMKALNHTWSLRLQTERQAFDTQQQAFEKRLQELDEKLTSEATEQSRAVLSAMAPKNAMEHLMSLSLEDDVVLLKGLSEKNISKILKEFKIEAQPAEAGSRAERGAKIFEALARGNPQRALLDQESQATGKTPTRTTPRTLPTTD